MLGGREGRDALFQADMKVCSHKQKINCNILKENLGKCLLWNPILQNEL